MQPEQRQQVLDLISQFSGRPITEVTEKAHFKTDLGLDSVDNVQMISAIDDAFEFELSDQELENVNCVGDLLEAIERKLNA